MPSMLGLTTDKSPHGLNAKGSAMNKENWQTENANYGQELASKAAGAVQGGFKAGRERRNKRGSDDSGRSSRSRYNEKGWKTPSRRAARKNNPNKPKIPEWADAGNAMDDGKNTIANRSAAAAHEMETLVWRALCDKPKSASKYMGKDCVVSNWLVFGDTEPRDADSEPTLQESLDKCEPYMSYRMHESQVVEIGLMAIAIVYEVTLFKQAGQPDEDGAVRFESDEATCTSVWRQTAGGDWEMASMTAA